jgi:glycosyltransferase involved in cell wall biosynthesis
MKHLEEKSELGGQRQSEPGNKVGRPLRISVVEPSGQLYGSELALLDIIEGLDACAFQVEVVLPHNASFKARLSEARVSSFGLLAADLQYRSRFLKSFGYLRMAWHWKQQRPDLIYVNQGGVLRPVAKIARRLRLPILCQVQTVEDANWVSALPNCHAQVMAFVCNSHFVAAAMRVPADRLSIVYYGYKYKGLNGERRQSLDPARPLQAGLLGRICRNKGHELLVQAAGQLKMLGPMQFQFRFIGDAIDLAEMSSLRAMITQLNVGTAIEFRGYRRDISAELAALDLLVIPSVAEPFGRILCEAAEARVPVLLSDSGGLGELSRRFGMGVRFEGGSVDELVRHLRFVRDNYQTVASDFGMGAKRLLDALNLTDYLSVMEQLLVNSAARKPVSLQWLGGTIQT